MKTVLSILLALGTYLAQAQKNITIEDICQKGVFAEESINKLNWMNDGQFYTDLVGNQIIRYDITKEKPDSVIIDGKKLNLNLNDYQFSADQTKILLLADQEYIYRRSFTADYFVFTFKGQELKKLSQKGRQSYATFSPDNSMVAFVRNNNLYYVKLVNMSEYAVTEDGKFGKIINGSSDWVYEEEFYLTKAFDWAADSKKLAYMTFDETAVKEYNLQYWDDGALYPRDYKFKYPKAGEDNAKVSVTIYNLLDNKKTPIELGKDKDIYVPRIQWTKDPTLLSMVLLNREQNKFSIVHASSLTGSSFNVLTDTDKKYIDIGYAYELIYLNNKEHFLYSSEREGFKHYYLHKMDGQLIYKCTSGVYNADKFIGLDQSSKTAVLYYLSTEDSPLERHLYKVPVTGAGKVKLSTMAGTNDVDISKDFKYYINFNSSSLTPNHVSLVSNKTNKLVCVLTDNSDLKQTATAYGLSKKVYFELESADKKLINGYMLQPAKFDSTKKYPVLVYQYSGPGSQEVTNEWSGNHFYWHQLLTQQGYIVAVVDVRGTGGRGTEFKKQTYMQLGKLEADDLAATALFLGKQSFVDTKRIGLWGWSYGGYMAALTLMKYPGVFKLGIAVAPVTSWRFYDTVYSERYLQRPQDNKSGYDDNSPVTQAAKLEDKLLLIHGTGDDNVHFQNAMALQNALINEGKQFDSFYYPDRAHGMGDLQARLHLYHMMTNYITTNL